MPHIHTEPNQHDHTVTAYIVRTDEDEPRILLHQHRKLHKLLPVGGHIELDETPWQAMAHEILEESGYDIRNLFILQPPIRIHSLAGVAQHPYPIVANTHDITPEHYHSDTAYAFIAKGRSEYGPQEGESTDLRWLTAREVKDLSEDDIWQNTQQVCEFILTDVITKWELVPASNFALTYDTSL